MARTGLPVPLGVIVALFGLLGAACGLEGRIDEREARRPAATAIPALGPDADIPDLVVASGSDVYRFVDGHLSKVGSVDGEAAVALDAGDGSIVVQRDFGDVFDRRSDLVRLRGSAVERVRTPAARRVYLFERALIGTPKLLFAAESDPDDVPGDDYGGLWFLEVSAENSERITQAFGPEFYTGRASYGAGVIALTAGCDLTECLAYFRPDGEQVDGLPNPTDELEYAMPPLITDFVFSPDGQRLAYLEGPDVNSALPEVQIGDWTLVVLNRAGGSELLRLRVAGQDTRVRRLDFDGRWAFISLTDPPDAPASGFDVGEALPVLAVDTTATRPGISQIPGVVGVASVADRLSQ